MKNKFPYSSKKITNSKRKWRKKEMCTEKQPNTKTKSGIQMKKSKDYRIDWDFYQTNFMNKGKDLK